MSVAQVFNLHVNSSTRIHQRTYMNLSVWRDYTLQSYKFPVQCLASSLIIFSFYNLFHKMSDLRSFSKDFMIEFIDLYKSYPCLWKIKCKDYMNRNKKDAAYEVLVKKLQEVEPNATKKIVKAKINSIRGSFRREMKRIQESKRSGAGTDEIYVTHLWYYDLLLFCKDQEVPRSSISNIESKESEQTSDQENGDEGEETQHVDDDIDSVSIPTPSPRPTSRSSTTTFRSTIDNSGTTASSYTASQNSSKKRKNKVDQQADDILTLVGERLRSSSASNDDPCNIFGKNVAAKLRTLSKETRLYTEKLINDLLFEAEMGNVNNNTKIVTSASGSRNQIESQLNAINTANINTAVYPPDQYHTYVHQNEYQLPRPLTSPCERPVHQMHASSPSYQSHSDAVIIRPLSSTPRPENSITSFFGNYQPNIDD